MNELYSIRMTGEPSLQHWKYIKKVKTSNGKWRYIYDNATLQNYNHRREYKIPTIDGPRTHSFTYTNDIYDSTTTIGRNYRIKGMGLEGRIISKAEKFIYKHFYDDNRFTARKVRAIKTSGARFIKDVINA